LGRGKNKKVCEEGRYIIIGPWGGGGREIDTNSHSQFLDDLPQGRSRLLCYPVRDTGYEPPCPLPVWAH